jgi:hypothetical protein
MTNPISGRYPPVFRLIDDPRDPENAQRLEAAERFRRDNPSGLLIHRRIVCPPNGKLNWGTELAAVRLVGVTRTRAGRNEMPYKITFEPRNRIAGVKAKTVEIENAAKAWIEVQGLMYSDERVTTVDPHGHTIEWHELKEIAAKEAN